MAQPQQASQHITIYPQRRASLAVAQGAAGFRVRMPRTLPVGYEMEAIDHILHRVPGEPQADFLVISFRAAGGHYLRIEHGFHIAYDQGIFRLAPLDQKGTIMVQGQPAVWFRGFGRPSAQGPRWEAGPLSLRWKVELIGSQDYIGYGLTSDALSLEQLVEIADSVRPLP